MSSSSKTQTIPCFSQRSHPARFEQVLAAIARTRKMMILCGETASAQCGLPPIDTVADLQVGTLIRRTPLRTLIRDCSPTVTHADQLDARLLAALNHMMASRRVAARLAPASRFHELLSRLCAAGVLVACITTSFDGLEARGDPLLDSKMVMLHGDNRLLRCCRNHCAGLNEEETRQLDGSLLESMGIPGSSGPPHVLCKVCLSKYKKTAIAKRGYTERSLALRPAVQLELGSTMMAGRVKAEMVELARTCQLLLILEQPLKAHGLIDLTRDLAEIVREHSGAVVYVGPEPLSNQNALSFVDLQLQTTTLELVTWLSEKEAEAPVHPGPADVPVHDDQDFWLEITSNELPPRFLSEDAPYAGPVCEHCSCSVPEYLVGCSLCSSQFCCRRVSYDESSDAELDEGGLAKPTDTPNENDSFELEAGCIVLNHYSPDGRRPPLEQARREFVCYDCWNHREQGLYPHFVRAVPRLRKEWVGRQWPRQALIVYYVEQFWPEASHIMKIIAGRWANKGWSCAIEPIKLEHLAERQPLFPDLSWEPKSYSVFVLYLTHGLTGEQGYQLSHMRSLQPVEFLQHTLPLADDILRNARETRGFLWCCGHPLYHSGLVADLAKWVNSDGRLDTLVGAMNPKLCVSYIVNLAARLSTKMVDPDPHAADTIFRTWLTDTVAASHTDLIFLARESEPMLWLFAPFQSRPLGKPLPNILSTCTCPDIPLDRRLKLRRQNSRKTWEVDHNGRDGVALRDVTLKASCTVCRQLWRLPSEHMAGTLRKYCDMFAAIVPYMAPTLS